MIRVNLEDSVLKKATLNTLRRNQDRINHTVPWETKVEAAKDKWDQKPDGAFADIKERLMECTAGIDLCCYCEHNEAAHIEHVFPKKLFPERAFLFSNYVMSCPNCNTEKLDGFAVFLDADSQFLQEFIKGGPKIEPSSARSAFIDPRTEDPMAFFLLDLTTGEFIIDPSKSARDRVKAAFTLDLLKLNTRHCLPKYRVKEVGQYKNALLHFIGCRDANSMAELIPHFPDKHFPIDANIALDDLKRNAQAFYKQEIKEFHFPTIWLEIKRQITRNPDGFKIKHPVIAKAMHVAGAMDW